MSRVAFVIGGYGFVGRHLVARLLREGWRVGVIDPGAAAEGEVTFGGPGTSIAVVRSVASAEAMLQLSRAAGQPARIFHLGGSGSVGAAERDPSQDRALTVQSTEAVIELMAELPTARLVFVSSAAVYGEASSGRLAETLPSAPISIYGRHKAEAEDLILASGRAATIVRFFSLYGPGLRKQLLWDACHKLRSGRPSFAGTGRELRDWVHVDDAVDLLERVSTPGSPAVVNGGTGVGTSVHDVLELLRACMNVAAEPTFTGEVRLGDPRSLVADPTLAQRLGWTPRVPVARGLADYARWFEAQTC